MMLVNFLSVCDSVLGLVFICAREQLSSWKLKQYRYIPRSFFQSIGPIYVSFCYTLLFC